MPEFMGGRGFLGTLRQIGVEPYALNPVGTVMKSADVGSQQIRVSSLEREEHDFSAEPLL